jgi:uncharacterized membrane protein YgcG
MKFRKCILLLLVACLQFPVWGQVKPKIPRPKDDLLIRAIVGPQSYIFDFEFLFLENETAILDSLILAFKQRTTNEIAIVTLGNSQCDKEDFRDYTLQLANAWGIGHKEKNNGILIAISKEFRQIQIHNGKGIETILTNNETKQIIDNYFIPKFKTQNYFEGTKNGFLALIKIVEEKQKKHNEIEYFTNKLIELIEQKNIEALKKLTTHKIYCYLCFQETPKEEPLVDQQTFYTKHFKTIFSDDLIQRLKRNEKKIAITGKDLGIMVLYTTYRRNEFGDGHEGAQFGFWLKKEKGILKLNGIETVP